MGSVDALKYLDFEFSEDAFGVGTFDAMASVHAPQLAAVHAEIARVLAWAHATFVDQQAPLDEGGEWDYQLQGQQEWSAPVAIDFDADSGALREQVLSPAPVRHTLTLSISGSPQFCQAFTQRFGLA